MVTTLLLILIDNIPKLHIATDQLGQEKGLDEVELGEFAYDFVEKRRTFGDIPPAANNVAGVGVESNLEGEEA